MLNIIMTDNILPSKTTLSVILLFYKLYPSNKNLRGLIVKQTTNKQYEI